MKYPDISTEEFHSRAIELLEQIVAKLTMIEKTTTELQNDDKMAADMLTKGMESLFPGKSKEEVNSMMFEQSKKVTDQLGELMKFLPRPEKFDPFRVEKRDYSKERQEQEQEREREQELTEEEKALLAADLEDKRKEDLT